MNIVWAIWRLRNRCCFDDIPHSAEFIVSHLRVSFIETKSIFRKLEFMNNTVDDQIVRDISGRVASPRSYKLMCWYPPPSGWIKINADDAALGSSDLISYGIVFCNSHGMVVFCSHNKLGVGFSFEAEFAATVTTLEHACRSGFTIYLARV